MVVGPVTSLLDEGGRKAVGIGPVVDELRVDEVEDLEGRPISLQGANVLSPVNLRSTVR